MEHQATVISNYTLMVTSERNNAKDISVKTTQMHQEKRNMVRIRRGDHRGYTG